MTEQTTATPDPLAYGPTGIRCGCGKDAHSNLVPCQPDDERVDWGKKAGPQACGTCRGHAADGKQVEHEGCAQRATIIPAPDQPGYEFLADLTEDQVKALPARFHTPVFLDTANPKAWVCAVCTGEGWTTAWPCETAFKHGDMVFTDEHQAETEQKRMRARIAELEAALAATGRSLSSFIYDEMDPGVEALGAQWLYHQAMPQADDPFAQPRAYRTSIFEEAAELAEEVATGLIDEQRPQEYVDGYADGANAVAERLEKMADEAAEGRDAVRDPSPARERDSFVPLATSCANCGHPPNWHTSGPVGCAEPVQTGRCGCRNFAPKSAA